SRHHDGASSYQLSGTADTSKPIHVILFVGHRVDEPARPERRSPNTAVDRAKALIRDALIETVPAGVESLGIASAAPGGAIPFPEACESFESEAPFACRCRRAGTPATRSAHSTTGAPAF